MVYKKQFAAAIKVSGKILREYNGEQVYLPFGSEFAIILKNLNSVRASVKVWIDGQPATDGVSLTIEPNSSIELERFISSGNLKVGNKFKFIERTETIEDFRGIRVDDGLVRIEYQFENKNTTPIEPQVHHHYHPPIWHQGLNAPMYSPHNTWYSGGDTIRCAAATSDSPNVGNAVLAKGVLRANSVGITVPGSVSNQVFNMSSVFPMESEVNSLVIHLLGQSEDLVNVVEPITVKAKAKCTTCGKQNKATAKFCSECGTSLTIFR